MIGVGKIFEAFRDGRYPPFTERFEDDDEVAVIHGPADLGSRPLSDALVDLRECLARAEAGGVIDRLARDCLLERLKALPFGQRNFQTLLRFATEGLGATASEAHSADLTRHRVSQKREDAIALLQALRDQPERRIRDGWTFERTLEWERFVAGTSAAPLTGAESRALAGLERDPAHARTLRRRGAARLAAIELASETGLQGGFERFPRGPGLAQPQAARRVAGEQPRCARCVRQPHLRRGGIEVLRPAAILCASPARCWTRCASKEACPVTVKAERAVMRARSSALSADRGFCRAGGGRIVRACRLRAGRPRGSHAPNRLPVDKRQPYSPPEYMPPYRGAVRRRPGRTPLAISSTFESRARSS